ncbi:MAG: DUF2283 domain-containing protein [Phycisphaerales bacterium]|nr:DUF2283 domain-containing protein [Phycisphaerales bacterium]
MARIYLEITFCDGKPLAAYLQLPRKPGDKVARSKKAEAGMVIDFAPDQRPIGIEITAPSAFSIEALNRVMASLNLAPASPTDVAPLIAA